MRAVVLSVKKFIKENMLSACIVIVLLNVISSPMVQSMRRARARSRFVMPLASRSVDDDAIKLLIDDE